MPPVCLPLSDMARYVDDQGFIQERFLGYFVHLAHMTHQSVFNFVDKRVVQTYNGAATMECICFMDFQLSPLLFPDLRSDDHSTTPGTSLEIHGQPLLGGSGYTPPGFVLKPLNLIFIMYFYSNACKIVQNKVREK